MSEIALDSPPSPVALGTGHSFKEAKTLELRCPDRYFESATVMDETGTELFSLKSKYGKSWSFRRSLFDAAGAHVLDLRHYSLDVKNRWTVEDAAGKQLAEIEHAKQVSKNHSNVDLTVLGAGGGAEDAVVRMRQKDSSAITTHVAFEGATVAEIGMTERNMGAVDEIKGKDRTVWRIRVAPMMDLSIVVVMALCRAEMAHVWRQ